MTPEDAERVCAAVRLSPFEAVSFADIASAIDAAVSAYATAKRRSAQISEAVRRDAAKRVSARAGDLLASLGYTIHGHAEPEKITPGLGVGGLFAQAALRHSLAQARNGQVNFLTGGDGMSAVMNTVRAIQALAVDAKNVERRASAQITGGGAREDKPYRALLIALADIYASTFGYLPAGGSPNGQTPSGPFMRFVSEVTAQLPHPKDLDAQAAAWKKVAPVATRDLSFLPTLRE